MDRSGYSTTKSGKTLAVVSALRVLTFLGLIAAIGLAVAAGAVGP